ncbi:MAG: SpoIID/LytB domain-containing protein [Clostridia bacterium]|nr:SpoIID/LytB domain-containing protein [Clostridia bacterium]
MKKIMITLLTIFLIISTSFAVTIPKTIRVGLSYGTNAVSTFKIYAASGLTISEIGKMTGTITVSKSGSNKLTFDSGSNSKTCVVDSDGITIKTVSDDEYISYNGTQYRGDLVLYRLSGSDITVVNVVGLESYLYGVVPREMSTGHPIEALKAQAVAARTYAIMSANKYKRWNFDVTNTTSDQVYGGKSVEKEDTTKAVKETKGEVVTYDGKIVSTPFFSTSNGYTENSENVWNMASPHLVAVEDKYQPDNAPYLNWKVTYTKEEIEELLKGKNIGSLVALNILETSPSGSVVKLEFEGTDGKYVIEKERTRTFFSLRSQYYEIEGSGAVTVLGANDKTLAQSLSNLSYVKGSKTKKLSSTKLSEIFVQGAKSAKKYLFSSSADEYVFNGSGWGHGVGMSQNGAIGMAKEGFDYDEILKWYYTDIEIEKGE